MPAKVHFDRINLKFLNLAREKVIKNASWQGTLVKFNDRVLKPIALNQVSVAPEVKNEALALQRELIAKLFTLPKEKPTPKVTDLNPEEHLNILSEVICEGKEGEISSFEPQIAGLSVKGGRDNNEDALFIGRDGKILMVVADGMGGHGDGEKASAIAARTISDIFDTENLDLSKAYQVVHQALTTAKTNGELDLKAGTTLVSALIDPSQNSLKVANVGDSRAYLIREGNFYQITPDDSYFHVFYLSENRDLSFPLAPKLGEDYYMRSIVASGMLRNLRKVLGREPQDGEKNIEKPFPPFEVEIPLQEGDIVLLMSDGVHDYLPLATFKKLIENLANKSPLEISRTIKEAIKEPKDNITVAVYKHGKAKAQPKEESVPEVDKEKETTTKVYTPDDQPTVVWTKTKEEATKVFNLTPEQVAIIDKNAELQSAISRAAEIIASKNREIDQLKKTVEDLRTSTQILEREESALKKMLTNPLLGAKEYIAKEVDDLLKQYHALKEKLNHLVSQRKDYEAGIVDQERLLATLRKIVNDQKAPYLAEINKIEEEYQNALNTPEIKGLAAYIKELEKSGESGKLTLAKQTFAAAIAPLKRNRDAKIEEVNQRMKEELALEEREKMIKEREKAIEDLKLTSIDMTQNELEVEQELDNTRKQIKTLVGEVEKLINFLNSQISLLEEKSEISKKG